MDNKLILEQVKKILDKHLELKGLRKLKKDMQLSKKFILLITTSMLMSFILK